MEAKPTKKSPIVTVIAATIGAVVGSMLAHQYFNRSPTIDQALMATTSQINKGLPMMVDKETRLDNTVVLPNKTIVYRYTLVNMNAADIKKGDLTTALRPQVLNSYKTDESMKSFRENGVTMQYQYSDKNGAVITSFSVNPKDF